MEEKKLKRAKNYLEMMTIFIFVTGMLIIWEYANTSRLDMNLLGMVSLISATILYVFKDDLIKI